MSAPTIKLPRRAEELLQGFPAGEPDFEAQAKEIEARIATGVANHGVAFDELLKAPELATEAGEPALQSDVRAAPKSSFAEMARKSMQKKDDSAELTKELLAATAQSRRPNAEMVERVRAAGRVSPSSVGASRTPLPSSQREAAAEEAARPSGVVARVAPAAPAASPNQRGTIIGIAGVAVAIAACVALFLKTYGSDNRTSAALAAEKATERPAVPYSVPGTPAAAPKAEEGVVSPEALAAAPAAEVRHEQAKGAGKSLPPATAPALAAAPKAGPAPSAAPTEHVELVDDPEPAKPVAAKPEPEPPLKPAEGNSGSVPLTPSAGAVSTALSSVRSGAQACLAGQTEPVSAVVTFAADGHVLRVSTSGASAACIQAALSRAHIAPFARESFSAPTTIRPP